MPAVMTGCTTYKGSPLPVLDLMRLLGKPADAGKSSNQIVIMKKPDGTCFGLLVDDLGEITEVLTDRLVLLPAMVADQQAFADSVISPNDNDDENLIVVLRAERLYGNLAHSAPRAAASVAHSGSRPAAGEPGAEPVAKTA
jgi:chemotaxis signal transduction protein